MKNGQLGGVLWDREIGNIIWDKVRNSLNSLSPTQDLSTDLSESER